MRHQRKRLFGVIPTASCTCGLSFPCPDDMPWRQLGIEAIPDQSARLWPVNGRPNWDAPTVKFWSTQGRAGGLTPLQARRGQGGW